MNNGKELLGLAISLLAVAIAIIGVIGFAVYAFMMAVWFHVPVLDVLTLVVPICVVTLSLAWLCSRTGAALRQNKRKSS